MLAAATSKIAPHEFDAFLEIGEALLEVFYVFRHVFECFSLYFTNAHGRNPWRALKTKSTSGGLKPAATLHIGAGLVAAHFNASPSATLYGPCRGKL